MVKSIGIFCGSSVGNRPEYAEQASLLGRLLVAHDIQMVYGGGNVGMMGTIADAMVAEEGKVIGVIPDFLLDKELAHAGVKDMRVVDSMSVRKNLIVELSDAFIAMPGGFGTFDEVMEVITNLQLGLGEKPVAFLNTNGFYDAMKAMIDRAVEDQFIKPVHSDQVIFEADPKVLLEKVINFEKPEIEEKWIDELKQKNTY
jgi:uncharacterized protein (TIGR00730 family)